MKKSTDPNTTVFNKSCNDCMSRVICPTRSNKSACDGYNNEGTFKGLLMLCCPSYNWDKLLAFVKSLQDENDANDA